MENQVVSQMLLVAWQVCPRGEGYFMNRASPSRNSTCSPCTVSCREGLDISSRKWDVILKEHLYVSGRTSGCYGDNTSLTARTKAP